MKILIAEYTQFNNPYLAPEGKVMVDVLRKSFEACGYEVVTPSAGKDFGEEISRLAPECEYSLVITPDAMLSKYTHIAELASHNIGSDSTAAAVAANKRLTSKLLAARGIAVPKEVGPDFAGKRVIKPIKGEGSVNVRIAKEGELPNDGEMAVEYIEGKHFSVSLVGSRVVGEACGFYSGLPPVLLTVNSQNAYIDESGFFRYAGGETPVHPPQEKAMFETAAKTIEALGCQGYVGVDMVVSGDAIYVVDVNARPTMSIVGITKVIEEELADILLKATVGLPPEQIHYNGKTAAFDAEGGVTVK